MASLKIENLSVTAEDQPILKGINLEIPQGKVHTIMGPNGTGKTTLAYTLMGHPRYIITSGSVALNGIDLLSLPPEERSKQGIFLAFQYPVAIPGVTVANFLRTALKVDYLNTKYSFTDEIIISGILREIWFCYQNSFNPIIPKITNHISGVWPTAIIPVKITHC